MTKRTEGVRVRHREACPANDGRACKCRPRYEAQVWTRETGKIRRSFRDLPAAKSWRRDALRDAERGTLAAPSKTTLKRDVQDLCDRMQAAGSDASTIRNAIAPLRVKSTAAR